MKRTPPMAAERIYLATFRDGATYGVAIRRDDGPVIIGQSDAAAATAFADDLAQGGMGLQGVVGALPAVEAFAQRWNELTGRVQRLRVRLRQHALVAVKDLPAADGLPRTATEADIDRLIEWQCAFAAEVGLPDPPARIREILPKRVLRGELWIWDHGGPVACAGYNDAAPEFARIAPVYTPPGSRMRGYATSLVARMASELLTRGKRRIFLTTDIANPTSNAIYARIGFRAENDDWHFDFVPPET
jgi:predicted GNAT family acetyltransferase